MARAKTIVCKAGKTTKIISNFGSGHAKTFKVDISGNGELISGTFIEKKYLWIFPKAPNTGEIEPHMLFHRDWINGIYKVYVTPDQDVIVEIN